MKYVNMGTALTPQEAHALFQVKLGEAAKVPKIGGYSIHLKSDDTFIGVGKLSYMTCDGDGSDSVAEVGYGLMPEFWGHGYAQEMLSGFIEIARRIENLKQLVAIVHPDNLASRHIVLKAGFIFDKNIIEDEGFPVEVEVYNLVL
jgi:RimJ/RimL family protein N-acetyltransferase